jgi:hypothetical protein
MHSTHPLAQLVLRVMCLLQVQTVALSVQQVSMHSTFPLAQLVLRALCLLQVPAVVLSV